MKKQSKLMHVITVIIVTAAVIIMSVIYINTSAHWSPSPDEQKAVERLIHTPKSDIPKISVSFSNVWEFTLSRPTDDNEINELLNSLRHLEVVYTKSCIQRGGGLIIVTIKSERYNDEIVIEGQFKPGERFISESLRSDDLGKIIYKIAKQKGIKLK